MKVSTVGLNMIKKFEGCRLTAYKCVSNEKYYTIGYGHYGKDVRKGSKISLQKAEDLLKKDLLKFEKHVSSYDDIYNFTQCQFDALVSFAYNIGNIDGLTKNGTRTLSMLPAKMKEYTKCGGVELKGLVTRRQEEVKLFKQEQDNLTAIAVAVIAGKYGNGKKRVEGLKKDGYDPVAVQNVVNKLLKG